MHRVALDYGHAPRSSGAGEQLVGRHDFVDRAPFLRRLAVELLAGEDEVAAAYGADRFLSQQIEHDAEFEMGLVLKTHQWVASTM